MDSMRAQAGMLSLLTSQTDEITRACEVFSKIISTQNFNFLPWKILFNKGCCYESMHSINQFFSELFNV